MYFSEQKMSVEILKIMKPDHIQKVLKDFDWGTIIKFENSFENWRSSIGKPLNVQTTFTSVLHSGSNPPSPSCSYSQQPSPSGLSTSTIIDYEERCNTPDNPTASQISLANILNESPKGYLLVEGYKFKNKFNTEQRNMMIHVIAQYFDDKKLPLTLSTSQQLEREIVQRFPSEKLVIFFLN